MFIRCSPENDKLSSELRIFFDVLVYGKKAAIGEFVSEKSNSTREMFLLQVAGRVTDPTWGQSNEDAHGDVILMYAENCLAQGDIKAARAAFKYVLRKPGDNRSTNSPPGSSWSGLAEQQKRESNSG
jgi:hypothetical protein